MSAEVSVNIKTLKNDLLKHMIANNRYLSADGKLPVAIEVVGDSGIGKTSSITQVAKEEGLQVVKLNLAQIEELGDLVGFPIRQFSMRKGEENIWVDEHTIDANIKLGYEFTGKNRTSYCPPEWIADKGEGGILLLDDWNRADNRFIQATMELIDRQTYMSWKLPRDWHIILSANPDDGSYSVNSTDDAQRTRYISANLRFDVRCWSEWAEQNSIDTRCINFLMLHPELVTKKVNARSITTFFNCISSLKSFEESLPLIRMLGEGSVGTEFSSMFVTFINNKLDKLIPPHEILMGDNEENIINRLKNTIGSKDKYRGDIASVIATRIINYALFYAKSNPINEGIIKRLISILLEDIFNNDLKYLIAREIAMGNKMKFMKLATNSDISRMIIK